ncbi:hypothetical protein MMC10_002032 [Thelotrema lepadinum]|nr:hypothetical protein [Thelotrema lepadinum]
MFQFFDDHSFHYEFLRSLALTRNYGSDITECLQIIPNIKPGDFEDWYREWHNLALRVLSTIDKSKLNSYSPVTLRDVYFRASHYFFMSDFFLHGNPSDPRSDKAYELWREYFDKANALLPIPGQHVTLHTDHGFDMPVIIYRAPEASASNPRPTLILGGGFDSNMEELLHVFGFPAFERGYNVVLYEGPGQPTLIHKQHVGFIPDWEKAVTPIVDYIFEHESGELSFIDTSKIGLLGYSLGGYLAARAAAFEPRLAAVICIDGTWSLGEAFSNAFPEGESALDQGDEQKYNAIFDSVSPTSPTTKRWMHDHLKFSFCTTSGYEAAQRARKMDLTGVANRIQVPVLIGEAEEDQFFGGQPAKVQQAIGQKATLVKFTAEQGAQNHCQSGAGVYLNQTVMEWFAKVIGEGKS